MGKKKTASKSGSESSRKTNESEQTDSKPKPSQPAKKSKTDDADKKTSIPARLIEILRDKKYASREKEVEDLARETFTSTLEKYSNITSKYNVLMIFDEQSQLLTNDADSIYAGIESFEDEQDILLVIHSNGGQIEPAYLISKLCRKASKDRFLVAVPRRAKSAATLVCCGAHEIHLGGMSELGPIDPQINRRPALALQAAVEKITGLVRKQPASGEMFAEYLKGSLPLPEFGYYDRVVESAVQYATRLLAPNAKFLPKTPDEIATHLVHSYKDHGFVIDMDESREIFGDKVVRHSTPEYQFANVLYKRMSFFNYALGVRDKCIAITGSAKAANITLFDND